jgi:hypothetical protein
MKKHQDNAQTKRVNQTFSIPVDVSNELHVYVKHREMSRFVSDAIRKELEAKKDELRKEYADMKNDPAQREVMKDWESTIGDGIDENEW